ncbi:hypothetical protein GLOTRDRAFT_73218 [Gloeophyllum trabeum ATCC 11539]|uniref:T-cell immunomodulatory protein TIP C2 domain-containing protein n=1 Tax=Gloeophyllum trabeum (strain ATCC 11539 / FP-39264 / Madison 617) TaxID=670483 RepID=S7QFN9_GLOTA|nr:uncharacterized protein GLOTRDRAFT_73218 [Gloeophyllum trabeum ATCC 11539]EPQ58671.1 hypothetical protein GLOTRDRAFT_73218 [Gloeophyllum trabeum ATCC 11539]
MVHWKSCLPTSLLLLALAFPAPSHSIWPFPPKRYTGNALLEAGKMGVDVDGRVIAFGDFNGDQFLDILALGSDQRTLSVYLWNHEDYVFRRSATFTHPQRVQNVVPGDYTQNGRLDLLVMSHGQGSRLDMSVYMSSIEGGFDTASPIALPPSTLQQPVPIDANGDMKIDLFGVASGGNGAFKVWRNVWNASDPRSSMFDVVDPQFDGTQCRLANPHSNAVVDLNGDCLADLFLVCDDAKSGDKYYQIWVNNKDAGFALERLGRLPSGVQAISFADIDRDGTIDMIFPTCSYVSSITGVGTDCYINIAYNKQLPLCASTTDSGIKNGRRVCRPPEELCTPDVDFMYDLDERSGNDAFVRFPVSALFPSASLLVLDKTSTPALPLPLRLADTDQDGFPDVLAVVVPPPAGPAAAPDRTPKLVLSMPCAKGVAGCDKDGKGRRGFKVVRKGAETLDSVKDARGVAVLDVDEDGTLDIMVQRTGEQGQGNVFFVQNNFYYDAFFLKAIVLNGACNSGWCTTPNGTARYHPFGVSYSGATYKYTVLDTSGRRSAAQVGQLPQTSYQALMTPYSYFGLGRTNNYIENLFVGSTKHTAQHYINMEGVIPNSKVVIIPPPEGQDVWKRELYLRPGEWIPWVTVTVVVATIILGVIVLALHLNEKREDELERRRASHHINFDAL